MQDATALSQFLSGYRTLLVAGIGLLLGGAGLMRGAAALAAQVRASSLPRSAFLTAGGLGLALSWGPLLGVAFWWPVTLLMSRFGIPTPLEPMELKELTMTLLVGGTCWVAVPAILFPPLLGRTSELQWPERWDLAVFSRSLVYPFVPCVLGVIVAFALSTDPDAISIPFVQLAEVWNKVGIPARAYVLADLMLVASVTTALCTGAFAWLIVHDT